MPEPLTWEDCVDYFAKGCKPKQAWRIGTEHEKIGFCLRTLRPVPYEGECGIRKLLDLLATEGWSMVYENGRPIALKRGDASITLEPGGQLELSGAPLFNLHQTAEEVNDHFRLLRLATDRLGMGFLSLGFQPKWKREDIPWMPKARYAIMRRYMPLKGRLGLDMMLRTATIQANLDFSDERDMREKVRIGACLQPIVTALFASSPFVDGALSGYRSYRAHCWLDTDPDRTGIPAMFFSETFGFEHYAQWLMDVPMYFVIRDGRYINCAGQSFRSFFHGKLPALPGERPTLEDWALHATTVYPEVRLKTYIEMRGADAGPSPWILALPALWMGLLYDEDIKREAWEWVSDWRLEEVRRLRRMVPVQGISTPFRGTTVHQLAKTMVDLARRGLQRRHESGSVRESEVRYLAPLEEALDTGLTLADRWIKKWNGPWQRNIDHLFKEAIH